MTAPTVAGATQLDLLCVNTIRTLEKEMAAAFVNSWNEPMGNGTAQGFQDGTMGANDRALRTSDRQGRRRVERRAIGLDDVEVEELLVTPAEGVQRVTDRRKPQAVTRRRHRRRFRP